MEPTRLTPTSGIANGDDNQIKYFWDQHYSGIKYANTILSYIDAVEGLGEEKKTSIKVVLIFTVPIVIWPSYFNLEMYLW